MKLSQSLSLHVYYNRSQKSWYAYLTDANGDQIGDATVNANRDAAVALAAMDYAERRAASELLRQRDALASALKRLLNRLDWSGRPGRDPQQLGISSVDMDLATARNTIASIEKGA